jgi:hypothetical protein
MTPSRLVSGAGPTLDAIRAQRLLGSRRNDESGFRTGILEGISILTMVGVKGPVADQGARQQREGKEALVAAVEPDPQSSAAQQPGDGSTRPCNRPAPRGGCAQAAAWAQLVRPAASRNAQATRATNSTRMEMSS